MLIKNIKYIEEKLQIQKEIHARRNKIVELKVEIIGLSKKLTELNKSHMSKKQQQGLRAGRYALHGRPEDRSVE